LLWQQTTSLT